MVLPYRLLWDNHSLSPASGLNTILMKTILAIETATDACSVALSQGNSVRQRHEITPRQHSQRLLGMLEELLPGGTLLEHGVEAVAYGCGPGSFTGLRIAASAVQGLCFATGLPAVPLSTLAVQAQTAYRLGHVKEGQTIFSALDARIKEIYSAWFVVKDGRVVPLTLARACSPSDVQLPDAFANAVGIGSGCHFIDDMPHTMRSALQSVSAEVLPEARDLVPLALELIARGETQTARQVQPVYVRDEINWKKIPQQGKQT